MKSKQFYFSASTCAFQVEGGRNLGGRTDSIWDEFTKRNFYIPPTGVAKREINSIEISADLFHKYKTDVRIMKRLGLNSLVYNMDWTRIFPKNDTDINPEGIKFYDDFFNELVNAGIKPIPILFHWDTPMWAEIKGGWENREIIDWFSNYVKTCFKYLGKYTDTWFVNDENSSFAFSGYLYGGNPPDKKDKKAFLTVLHHLNLSAAQTKVEFEKAKSHGFLTKKSILGIDHDWSPPIPYSNLESDQNACLEYNEFFKNMFLDPNLKGTYPKVFYKMLKEEGLDGLISDNDLDFLANNTLDLIGWNYYRPVYISSIELKFDPKEFKKPADKMDDNIWMIYPINDQIKYTKWNWIINPDKLVDGAIELSKDYGKDIPIMIIENGFGDFDNKANELILDIDRIEYLQLHLAQTLKAREYGVNMIGYSLWTYCDIFSPSGGYRKDYGLVSVDFNSPTRDRKPKLSYVWYQLVIKSNGKKLLFSIDELETRLVDTMKTWDLFYI